MTSGCQDRRHGPLQGRPGVPEKEPRRGGRPGPGGLHGPAPRGVGGRGGVAPGGERGLGQGGGAHAGQGRGRKRKGGQGWRVQWGGLLLLLFL